MHRAAVHVSNTAAKSALRLPFPGNFPHLGLLVLLLLQLTSPCSAAYACPSGWTLFTDDGVEGHDSCIQVFNTTGLAYADANAVCASNGGHLLTFANPSQASGLPVASIALSPSTTFRVSCSQSASASLVGAGWSWIDGTDGGNVNCGVSCGL